MIDLGRKDELSGEGPIEAKVEKNKIRYPNFYIHDVDLGLDEKDVGKVMDVKVKIRVNRVSKSISTRVGIKTKKDQDYDFDVMSIGFDKGELAGELNRQLGGDEKDGK